jgi:hypothetical protein
MSDIHRVGDLEISQDLNFQRRSWAVQRFGWVMLALLILAACLGFFGPGPLSRAMAGRQDGPLRVEYHRFWRLQSPMSLRLHVGPQAARGGQARVWLSRSYLEAMSIQHVTPQPQQVEAGPDRFTYVFTLSPPERPTAVTFNLEPETPGSVPGQAGLENGLTINFRHFIYP